MIAANERPLGSVADRTAEKKREGTSMATAKTPPSPKKAAATKAKSASPKSAAKPKQGPRRASRRGHAQATAESTAKAKAPPPPPPIAPHAPTFDAVLSPDQRQMLEKLSANLARAAVTAQGAIAEAALRQADRPAALNADPFHVAPAMNEVMSAWPPNPTGCCGPRPISSAATWICGSRPPAARPARRPSPWSPPPPATSVSTTPTGRRTRCST
jgi:hypothetical protein